MPEIYKKWDPISDPPFPIDLESLNHRGQNLLLIFYAENHPSKKLSILFNDIYAYRETGDEFRSHFWHEVELEEDHAFFLVEDSDYLVWFNQQSADEFNHLVILHYAIWTTENWIDILSVHKPDVKWID